MEDGLRDQMGITLLVCKVSHVIRQIRQASPCLYGSQYVGPLGSSVAAADASLQSTGS